jgi:importin subunit alpha-1
MANLCDGQPPPSLDVPLALEALDELLLSDDTEVLSHACWALSHLCDGSSAHIRAVAEGQVCKRLVELLMHKSWRIAKPSLRTVRNEADPPSAQCDFVLMSAIPTADREHCLH